jgi:hypothetical protein
MCARLPITVYDTAEIFSDYLGIFYQLSEIVAERAYPGARAEEWKNVYYP